MDPIWLARVDDYTAGIEQMTAADPQNMKTDEANYNSRRLEQILSEFRSRTVEVAEARGRVRFLAVFASDSPPTFEDANAPGRSHFIAEHDDHHLARIWELVNRCG
jgi:hypothetical protein